MTIAHVKVTTAAAIGLATSIVGTVCATVPNLAPYQSVIIAALTAVIVAVSVLANAIHALAGAKLSVGSVETDVAAAVQAELKRILTQGMSTPTSKPPPVVSVTTQTAVPTPGPTTSTPVAPAPTQPAA